MLLLFNLYASEAKNIDEWDEWLDEILWESSDESYNSDGPFHIQQTSPLDDEVCKIN